MGTFDLGAPRARLVLVGSGDSGKDRLRKLRQKCGNSEEKLNVEVNLQQFVLIRLSQLYLKQENLNILKF